MNGPAGAPGPAVSPDRLDLWLVHGPPQSEATAPGLPEIDFTGPGFSELDATERRRAESFVRPAQALLYATAHVALRRLLGRYTGVAPQDVRFVCEPCPGCGGAHGRPALARTAPPLHFSLSHSAGLALVGIAAVPVGVDVERLPREETVEVCAPALHPRERAELARIPRGERSEPFGRLWTRKEAYLKGIGTGLSRSPAHDYLGADRGGHPPGWAVFDVACPPTHAAAAAVRGPAPRTVGIHRLELTDGALATAATPYPRKVHTPCPEQKRRSSPGSAS
ncbi:4'-phosphopantetheinyl transferase family protein [Streptomyces enissocaesilis]|uniref:4'-phosphopantetheinyl transferase domain-containing protein n=1 Tax=Streptomyces enissocaesilis TaxID=332589 RepID=A0ABP6K4M9_9ACTN